MRTRREWDITTVQQEFAFIGKVSGSGVRSTWPLDRKISWRQRGLAAASGEFTIPLPMESDGTPSDPVTPATFLCPPACQMFAVESDDGTEVFAYQPTVHVMGGIITAVSGSVNATYTVTNLDAAIEKAGLVPINRWTPEVNYQPLTVGSTNLLLLCTDAETLKLIAFEKPVFAPCPGPTPASSPRAMSWFGV